MRLSQNFDFLGLNNFKILKTLNFKTFWSTLKIRRLEAKLCVAFQRVHIFYWKDIYINFYWKRERSWKWKNSHTVLEKLTFNSYKNCKLKVKLWWVGAHERKKRTFFVHFVLSEGNFFKICFISCIVYWIHFQNIYTWTYQKRLLHTLLLLVSKIRESFQCILTECDSWI